jgi:putative transposase
LKYRPGFPDRFGSIHDAQAFCQQFFGWYNAEHRHSGIAMMTPEAIHYGHAVQLHQARAQVLAAAYAAHPERFVRKPPTPKPLPTAVWINPPESTQEATQ